jgi:hypothetical protein
LAYARQAKNYEMEIMAAEIRVRAERRAGELLMEMEKNKGAQGSGSNQYEVRSHDTSTPTLADRGITYDHSSHWQQLAKLSKAQEDNPKLACANSALTSNTLDVPQHMLMFLACGFGGIWKGHISNRTLWHSKGDAGEEVALLDEEQATLLIW